MKKLATRGVLLAVASAGLVGLSALAQNAAPPASIGPGNTGALGPAQGGPAPVPSKTILDGALSPETRQTLQDAMDSVDPASLAVTVKSLNLGPGEGAELDGAKVNSMAFAQLPAPLRAALGGSTQRNLTDSTGP